MARHLQSHEDFFDGGGGSHETLKDFGFHGSIGGHGGAHPPFAADTPTRGPKHVAEPEEEGGGDYAHGGHHMAQGGHEPHHHPHGHDVVHVEHREDGSVVHHHGHGGFTVHHLRGGISHHAHDGSPVHHAHGGMQHMAHGASVHSHPHGHHVVREEHAPHGIIQRHAHGGYTVHHHTGHVTHHHADGTPVHHAQGGFQAEPVEGEARMTDIPTMPRMAHGGRHPSDSDEAADKALIAKGIHQHEDHEHEGEHTDLHLARGGFGGLRARLPRGMRPVAARHLSPIETPPRNPNLTTTPRNRMPGGQMGYGVEPSAEPDESGGLGGGSGGGDGLPTMRRGGPHRRRRGGSEREE